MRAVTARRSFDPKNIELFRTKKVVLTFQQKVPFQVDGEYRGKIAKIEARILPGIVNVMLPVPSPPKEEAAGAQPPA